MVTVVKRDGQREPVKFDEILSRISECAEGLQVDSVKVAKTVIQGVCDGIATSSLDQLAVQTATSMATWHPDYSFLAARIAVSNLHKITSPSISCVFPRLSEEVRAFADQHREEIDAHFKWDNDFKYDIFGFRTLERSYLMRDAETQELIERPQTMLMRVSLGIHCGNLPLALQTYDQMSDGKFTHATPTMFNAGTPFPALASCFLLPVVEDSIGGIFETLRRCAEISKAAGGIGISFTNVRSSGAKITSTGGRSAGLVPFLRIYDATARAVDQGGGKRKGAFAIYLEPWHADVLEFLDLKKNHGTDELRARDLFYALWVPDLFMERVREDKEWSLFCPQECPDLVDLHGEAFRARYQEYEANASVRKKVMPARELFHAVLTSQIETGTPYMLYKDAANRKSNQQHLGTIRCSNLCSEIVQYSSKDEVAVCNLASVALPKFVVEGKKEGREFDFEAFAATVRIVTRNLNKVIDGNHYALEEAKRSNLRHRPIGIGVQGLADTFMLLGLPYESPLARVLNHDIFEALYFAALDASCSLAEEEGAYETFSGSPASKGLLQHDLWREEWMRRRGKGGDDGDDDDTYESERWDWASLRARIAKHGLRNSLLVAPMPTASTAQILGNTECFEPITSNLFVRRVLAGEFPVLNKHLVSELQRLGLWNEGVRVRIVEANGSVQGIEEIPEKVRVLFKTAWEMSMRSLIDLAADRGPFVDQSQSLNMFVANPTHSSLSAMHFYAWKRGLKTGCYYLRTKPAANAVQVTVPVRPSTSSSASSCRRGGEEGGADCESCSA